MSSNTRLVYSTSGDNHCPGCNKPLHKCSCKAPSTSTSGQTGVRIRRETKGRAGKQVTVIEGLTVAASERKTLLKKIKSRCGTGGTQKGDLLEIQGDHREVIKELLEQQGYQVRLSGG
ncbi:MAG: stress response translation initiation inhibitor YciH [Gammaproteobacteria bacterium]